MIVKYNNSDVLEKIYDCVNNKINFVLYGNTCKRKILKDILPDGLFFDSNEIIEVKWLSGLYAVEDFQIIYKEGILENAMKEGKTVIFENIEKNYELLDYLRSIVSEGALVNGRSEAVVANSYFQIIFTSTECINIDNVYAIGPVKYYFMENLKQLSDNQLQMLTFDTNLTIFQGKTLSELDSVEMDEDLYNKMGLLLKLLPNHFQERKQRRFTYEIISLFTGRYSSLLKEKLYLNNADREYEEIIENSLVMTSTVRNCLHSVIFNITNNIPTLLIGSTGIGKTELIQSISKNSMALFGYQSELVIINLSSDFDISLLIGGYKSTDVRKAVRNIFSQLGIKVSVIEEGITSIKDALLKAKLSLSKMSNKQELLNEINKVLNLLSNKLPFIYEEGILVEAMKSGKWVLFDEINLATKEVLMQINAYLCKDEKFIGYNGEDVIIHRNFRVFGSMNPAGDFGKKDVNFPVFTKIVMEDFANYEEDILLVVQKFEIQNYLQVVDYILTFMHKVASNDFTNILEPVISGRTLCRIFRNINQLKKDGESEIIAIYKSFSIFLFSQLNFQSRLEALKLFMQTFDVSLKVFGEENEEFIINLSKTYIVSERMKLIVNDIMVAIKANIPILLMGPTCTGKTSLIFGLAKCCNIKVLRINNHQHTDTSDYIGRYLNSGGGFEFIYGPLINAMKEGNWIILDELNLAPSDVLESLNRLLDDNKEIFISETNEVIKCHPDFRLFGTQNLNYGGRNNFPKSFRNRFIEISFYEKSSDEISEILAKTSDRPPSFIKIILDTYNKIKRISNDEGMITLRDLNKWTNRNPDDYLSLFVYGYQLLVLRQRGVEERKYMEELLLSVFEKNKKAHHITASGCHSICYTKASEDYIRNNGFNNLVPFPSFVQIFEASYQALFNGEPVLLVGETGIGKTKMCELLAKRVNKPFFSVNLNENTDASDLIGNFQVIEGKIQWEDGVLLRAIKSNGLILLDEINLAEDSTLERFNSLLEVTKTLFVPEIKKEFVGRELSVVATMNPSGDFGKRELSPALKSRFTELYLEVSIEEKLSVIRSRCNDLFLLDKFTQIVNECSLRKLNFILDHIDKLKLIGEFTPEQLWEDSLELVRSTNFSNKNSPCIDYLKLHSSINFTSNDFIFQANWNNFNKILRGLFHTDKGILLEGSPGTGKSSTVIQLSRIFNKKCLRINLSDSTEISDLLGTFIPKGKTIKFVESDFLLYLKQGNWVILDEINLCSQSVIEGLNSILDYRREIRVNNEIYKVHNEARIFGTMNPCGVLGRKFLPKSFLDRFTHILLDDYLPEQVKTILNYKFGPNFKFIESQSLRFNMIINQLEISHRYNCTEEHLDLIGENDEKAEFYECSSKQNINVFRIGDAVVGLNNSFISNRLSSDVVIIHSHLEWLYKAFKALINSVPIIVTGKGKSHFSKLLSNIFSLQLKTVYLHKFTETSDLLGQFVKDDNSDQLFVWQDSFLIRALAEESLIVFDHPELADKSVFDRLNSLFEFERFLSVYEKGEISVINVNPKAKFVLLCDNILQISEALRDRCLIVNLPETSYSRIDLSKMFNLTEKLSIENFVSEEDFIFCKNEFMLNLHKRNNNEIGFSLQNFYSNLEIDSIAVSLIPLEDYIEIADTALISSYLSILSFHDNNEAFSVKNNKLISYLKFSKIMKSYTCCDNFSLKNAIIWFLESLKNATMGDYENLVQECEILYSVEEIDCLSLNKVTEYEGDFKRVIQSEVDPLSLYLQHLRNEGIYKVNKHKVKLQRLFRIRYKYGGYLDEIKGVLKDIKITEERYKKVLERYDSISSRNWQEYKTFLSSPINLCEWLNSSDFKNKNFRFSDISDFNILLLIKKNELTNIPCNICGGGTRTLFNRINNESNYPILAYDLIYNGKLNYLQENEYAKYYFISTMKNNPLFKVNDNIESFIINDSNNFKLSLIGNSIIYSNYSLSNYTSNNSLSNYNSSCCESKIFSIEDIKNCIKNLFPLNCVGKIVETRIRNKVLISLEFYKTIIDSFASFDNLIEKINSMALFSTPTDILELLTSFKESAYFYSRIAEKDIFIKEVNEIEKSLFFNREDVLKVENNYLNVLYLYFEIKQLTPEIIESYFLSTTVYEFCERIYFSMHFVKLALISQVEEFSHNKQIFNLYAYSCMFYSLQITKMSINKQLEVKTKLRNNPDSYKGILEEYKDKFLIQPITKVIESLSPSIDSISDCECNGLVEISQEDSVYYKFLIINEIIDLLRLKEDKKSELCLCKKFMLISKNISKYCNKIIKAFNTKMDLLEKTNNSVTNLNITTLFINREINSDVCYSNSELNLSKLIFIFNRNLQFIEEKKVVMVKHFIKTIIEERISNSHLFTMVVKIIEHIPKESSETEGDGLKDGTGERSIKDKIDKNDVDNNEFKNDEEKPIEESSNAQDVSNEGEHGEEEMFEEEEDNNTMSEEPEIQEGESSEGSEECPSLESSIGEEDDSEAEDITNDSGSVAEASEEIGGSEIAEYVYKEPSNEKKNEDCCDNAALNYENQVESNKTGASENKLAKEIEKEVEEKKELFGEVDTSIDKEFKDKVEELVSVEIAKGKEVTEFSNLDNLVNKDPNVCSLVRLLRSVIENNKNSKYKGNYKSGRKLNMKAIVPYIASGFTNDKIWLRRLKQDKVDLTVRLFIDNSSSMFYEKLPLRVLSLYYKLKKAFNVLGANVEFYKFGDSLVKLSMSNFNLVNFKDLRTDISFINNEEFKSGVNVLLTDGIFNCNRVEDFGCLLIDVKNILKMNMVSFFEDKMFVESYLTEFPLQYEIVKDDNEIDEKVVKLIKGLINK